MSDHASISALVCAWLEEMGEGVLDGDALALDSFTLVELLERAELALLLESGGTP